MYQSTLNSTIDLNVGYDALGNITSKSDIGAATWTYDVNHKHAVATAGSHSYTYDESAAVVVKLSFDAFGKRRSPSSWGASPSTGDWTKVAAIAHRGFTSHEGLDNVGLIHMNGRVYDPLIGRFLSADPVIQVPLLLQSYNRYSYVLNNPLSLVDPTGLSWLSSEISGGCFTRGAELGLALAAVQWGAYQMRQYVVKDSLKNQYGLNVNTSGDSDGWNGDGFKTGGARAADADRFISDVTRAPFGGAQGGSGYLFGIAYPAGSWEDSLVEAFGGPHDWLSSLGYNTAGNAAAWTQTGLGPTIFTAYGGIALFPAAAIVGASTAPEIVITNGK